MVSYRHVAKEALKGARKAAEQAHHNPGLAICAVAAVGGASLVAAPGIFSTAILNTVGFTAAGVKSGSLAAGIHSVIGNAAAGSTFAALQSAGVGGAALGGINVAIQGTGAAVFGSAAYLMSKLSNNTTKG